MTDETATGRPLVSILRESWWEIVVDTSRAWSRHRTIRLGAGLAYYGLFAVVPVLTVGIALAGVVIDQADVEAALTDVLTDVVDGDAGDTAAAITDAINSSTTLAGLGLIGLGSLVIAGSLVFVALQDALDTIWEVPYRPGTRHTVRRRIIAFAVVMLSGAVFVASFAVSALASVVRNLAPGEAVVLEAAADALTIAGSWALAAVVLAALYRYLTDADVRWSVALAGGTATALGLTVGNRLVGEYLRRFGASSIAGAAGSLLVGLFWVYSIAQIVLAGAELTRSLQLATAEEPRPEMTGGPPAA